MIRAAAAGAAVLMVGWATLDGAPDLAAQGRGAGTAPAAPSTPAPLRDISGVDERARAAGVRQFDNAEWNTKTWLDRAGAPHSEQLKVTETFRRTAFDKLELDVKMEDPKVLSRPWTATGYVELRPAREIGDISCMGDYLEWPGA